MMSRVRRFLQYFLLQNGLFSERVKSLATIAGLIRQLRPLVHPKSLVRVGSAGDGGYLIPDDFEGITAVLSPGVGDSSSFEAHFGDLGIPCFLLDPTVDHPPIGRPTFFFQKIALGAKSVRNQSISLDDWVREVDTGGDLILQMDVEGAEWEILLAAQEATLQRFRFILVEFHSLQTVFSSAGEKLLRAVLDKMLKTHVPVHAHPNNCCGAIKLGGIVLPCNLEMTFARKWDRFQEADFAQLPHPLDTPNSGVKELFLNF